MIRHMICHVIHHVVRHVIRHVVRHVVRWLQENQMTVGTASSTELPLQLVLRCHIYFAQLLPMIFIVMQWSGSRKPDITVQLAAMFEEDVTSAI